MKSARRPSSGFAFGKTTFPKGEGSEGFPKGEDLGRRPAGDPEHPPPARGGKKREKTFSGKNAAGKAEERRINYEDEKADRKKDSRTASSYGDALRALRGVRKGRRRNRHGDGNRTGGGRAARKPDASRSRREQDVEGRKGRPRRCLKLLCPGAAGRRLYFLRKRRRFFCGR